jgi:hypothetical protein
MVFAATNIMVAQKLTIQTDREVKHNTAIVYAIMKAQDVQHIYYAISASQALLTTDPVLVV